MNTTQTKITPKRLVEHAISVRSLENALAVERAIIDLVGAEYRRPLGDIWNNFGLVSQAGDFDHKVIEAVTNAQDAILEREAAKRFAGAEVPYTSPREAAKDLLALDQAATRDRIHVDITSAGDEQLTQRKITIGVSDDGCGMTPAQMSTTVLQLGARHKSDSLYQQGAFGLGVKSTFRNAQAAVIITRRAPEMAGQREDRVAVAVVRWAEFGKGLGAHYLTTTDWADGGNPAAEPWSEPAGDIDFPVGTRLTLVEYQVKGLHRARSGDPKAFQAVASTRLNEPVIAFRHTSYLVNKPEPRTVYGLAHQLQVDPPKQRGRDRMPFAIDGVTYQLPINWWVFPVDGPRGRNSKVADGHVVSFTSSGQVHHHWDKNQFRAKTGLNKVHEGAYVVVETDALPITARTRLFTPDRAAMLPNDRAIQLEDSIAAFLKDHDELREINGQLQRAAVESALGSRKTRAVAQRISQAFHAKGFNTGGGAGPGRQNPPVGGGKPKKLKLLKEPTLLSGPRTVTVRPEDTRSITFWLNAQDSFLARGVGTFEVACDHPDLDTAKLPHSDLLNGRVRVNALIPETAKLGEFTLTATVPQWISGAGGLAGPLTHETTLIVTDEPRTPPSTPTSSGGVQGSGAEVALLWRHNLPANEAGHLEHLAASALANDPEYKDLAKLGEQPIPTIVLNENYTELKRYRESVRRKKGDAAVETAQGRYAAALGVGLLVMNADPTLESLSDEQRSAIGRAQARTALSLLPDFDLLMAQLEVD